MKKLGEMNLFFVTENQLLKIDPKQGLRIVNKPFCKTFFKKIVREYRFVF